MPIILSISWWLLWINKCETPPPCRTQTCPSVIRETSCRISGADIQGNPAVLLSISIFVQIFLLIWFMGGITKYSEAKKKYSDSQAPNNPNPNA